MSGGVLARVKAVNAVGRPEDSVALRATVCGAVLVAAHAVLREGVGGALLAVAVCAGIPAGFVLSHLARRRNRFGLKVVLAAGMLAGMVHFALQVSAGGTANLAQAQQPLAELFLWVQLLHAFDVPTRRDLSFSLVSSLVLLSVAAVLSISGALGLDLALWSALALVALVLAHRSELDERGAPLDDRGEPRAPPARRLVALARPVAVAAALGVVAASATFALAPPAGTARALAFPVELPRVLHTPNPGGLSNPTLGAADPARTSAGGGERKSYGYLGFADRLDTATRGRPDDSLVMRVRASAPSFWRGQTFDTWDGRVWTAADDRPRVVRGPAPLEVPLPADGTPVRPTVELVQTVYVARDGPNLLFAAPDAQQVWFGDTALWQLPDGSLRTGVQLDEGAVYTIVSRRPRLGEQELRAVPADRPAEGLPPVVRARTTAVAPSTTERVRRLAATVTVGATTAYDQVRALEAWMAANLVYSLDVPPLPAGVDAVDHFLFEGRVGYCEQIASSLVVLLRTLGIPARLAVGYTPGERNPFTGLFEVRASDAHAWAEVWFPGWGWVPFDPTAEVPLAPEAVDAAGSGVTAFVADRLQVPAGVLAAGGGALAVGVVGAVGWWGAGFVGAWLGRRRQPWAQRWLRGLEREGRRRGRARAPTESARAYAEALGLLQDERWRRAIRTVEAAAFGPVPPAEDERRDADAVLGAGPPR